MAVIEVFESVGVQSAPLLTVPREERPEPVPEPSRHNVEFKTDELLFAAQVLRHFDWNGPERTQDEERHLHGAKWVTMAMLSGKVMLDPVATIEHGRHFQAWFEKEARWIVESQLQQDLSEFGMDPVDAQFTVDQFRVVRKAMDFYKVNNPEKQPSLARSMASHFLRRQVIVGNSIRTNYGLPSAPQLARTNISSFSPGYVEPQTLTDWVDQYEARMDAEVEAVNANYGIFYDDRRWNFLETVTDAA